MKVKELLSSKSKWTKGATARDSQGSGCYCNSLSACCWCLSGAIYHCYPDDDEANSIHLLVRINLEGFRGVIDFNDNESTSFEEIKALVNELDI